MVGPPLGRQDEPASPGIDEAGVDRAQIRAMLDLSPEERLSVVEAFVDSALAIRRANEAPRLGRGYDDLLPQTVELSLADGKTIKVLDLPGLIEAKERAGRPKDLAALPVLRATLDETRRRR